MRIKKVDSKSIILHEETEVKFKAVGNMREVQFSAGVTKSVRYRIFLRINTLIEIQEKSKRERNLRTVTSLLKASERVSTN